MRKTKRKNTDSKEQKRSSAIRGAVTSCLFQLVSTGAILWVRSISGVDGWVDTALLIVAVASIVLILPVFAVLKQRLREIDGGEEEDAAIY